MNPADKAHIIKLKECYGFEHLHFYIGRNKQFHCAYIADPNDFAEEVELDVQFILAALSMQMAKIYFDDIKEHCRGAEQLKSSYLVFLLSGLT